MALNDGLVPSSISEIKGHPTRSHRVVIDPEAPAGTARCDRLQGEGGKAGQRGTGQRSWSADSELAVGARHVMRWQGGSFTPQSCP